MFPPERVRPKSIFVVLLTAGVALRATATILAGNGVYTPWKVGGDAPFYVLLASNIVGGKGFAYFSGPTAFRPPLYPLFLATMMRLFGPLALSSTRVVQFGAGLLTVWVCARIASRLFGDQAGRIALVIALFLPTLAAFPTELMTECLATLLAALFFDLVLENTDLSKPSAPSFLGLIIGLATLLRFNMAILGLVAVAALAARSDGRGWALVCRRVCVLTVVSGLVVSPWIVRNLIVFHGHVLLSTQSGINAVQGVLTPQGRVQADDLQVLHSVVGWQAGDLESNMASRYPLAPEPELDRRAWAQTFQLWRQENWRLIPLGLRKLGYFWLSTDQILWTHSFSLKQRFVRLGGALAQWILLAFAAVGWRRLRRTDSRTSDFLLGYAVLVSLVHLPFIMTSRYRISFLETILIVLAAGGFQLWTGPASSRIDSAAHTFSALRR